MMNKKSKKAASEYMRELGRKGGKKTAQRGSAYMSRLGRKGYEALIRNKAGSK